MSAAFYTLILFALIGLAAFSARKLLIPYAKVKYLRYYKDSLLPERLSAVIGGSLIDKTIKEEIDVYEKQFQKTVDVFLGMYTVCCLMVFIITLVFHDADRHAVIDGVVYAALLASGFYYSYRANFITKNIANLSTPNFEDDLRDLLFSDTVHLEDRVLGAMCDKLRSNNHHSVYGLMVGIRDLVNAGYVAALLERFEKVFATSETAAFGKHFVVSKPITYGNADTVIGNLKHSIAEHTAIKRLKTQSNESLRYVIKARSTLLVIVRMTKTPYS